MSPDNSGHSEDESSRNREQDDDELPRRGWLATVPKRNLARAVLLLGILAGILYLRSRTESIAACMANAFRVPGATAPARPSTESPAGSVKVRLASPPRTPDASGR